MSSKSESFSGIYDKVLESLSPEQLPEDNPRLLQEVFLTSRNLLNWKCIFERPLRSDISEEKCNNIKEKGRLSLQNKNMVDALTCFSQYIRLCHQLPNPTSSVSNQNKLLQQGYLNRSMIFYRVENYVRCIDDCDAAIYYGEIDETPSSNCQYVLYERKGKCYAALGNKLHAKTNFDRALEESGKANIPEKLHEAFHRQTKEFMKKLESIVPEGKIIFDENAEVTENTNNLAHAHMSSTNQLHTSMSSKTEIKHSQDKGRYIVANQDIDVGETLLVEKVNISYTYFDAQSKCSKACHHCLSSLCEYMAYYSPVADGLGFCSWKCLQMAMNSYHVYEKFLIQEYINELECHSEEDLQSACMFMAFKSIVSHPASFYLDNKCLKTILVHDPLYVLRRENTDEISLTPKEIQVKSLYNMETHIADTPKEERMSIAIRCVILLHCLKETHYLDKNCTIDQELHFLMLLFHFQFSIAYSVLQIYRVDGDMSGDVPLTALGSGIFDDLILFNHSCASNTTRFYQGELMLTQRNKKFLPFYIYIYIYIYITLFCLPQVSFHIY